jgi:hypothetical protein
MKRIALVLLLVFLAAPLSAGIRNCTAALVNVNVCRAQDTNDALTLDLPDARMDSAVKRAARMAGWSTTILCTDAIVADGGCTTVQLNTQVPFCCTSALIASNLCRTNQRGQALTRKQLAFAYIRNEFLSNYVISEEAADIDATKRAERDALVGAIPAVDGGD